MIGRISEFQRVASNLGGESLSSKLTPYRCARAARQARRALAATAVPATRARVFAKADPASSRTAR
jgi:hypothetical protein